MRFDVGYRRGYRLQSEPARLVHSTIYDRLRIRPGGSHPKTSVDVHRRPSQRAHIALLLRPPQVGVPSELDSVCREAQLDMIVFPTTERARTLTATILQIRAFSTDWAELCSLPSGGSGPITCSPCG